ncbi:MAG: hypothetical protein H0X37_20655 [Herpetosiphonaceae bacterium]|nr:hypothetical protein [Herpetosiphonaceae bacterium]
MPTLAADTSPEIEARQMEAMRQMPAWRKLQLAGGMNRMVRTLALRGLKRRYPEASDAELHRYFAEQRLGSSLAERVYGPLPGQGRDDAERTG